MSITLTHRPGRHRAVPPITDTLAAMRAVADRETAVAARETAVRREEAEQSATRRQQARVHADLCAWRDELLEWQSRLAEWDTQRGQWLAMAVTGEYPLITAETEADEAADDGDEDDDLGPAPVVPLAARLRITVLEGIARRDHLRLTSVARAGYVADLVDEVRELAGAGAR